MKYYAVVTGGKVIGKRALKTALVLADHIEIGNFDAVNLGDNYDGQDFTPDAAPFRAYSYPEFYKELLVAGKARALVKEMKKTTDKAADAEAFLTLVEAQNGIDFNDAETRKLAADALVPYVFSAGELDAFMGV